MAEQQYPFSGFRLGLKTQANRQHWTEDFELDPKKKTVLSLGGGGTLSGYDANGNVNDAVDVLGFTPAQTENMQLVSCYRQRNLEGDYVGEFNRQIWQRFKPFMAWKNENGQYERLTNDELAANFRNLIVQAHCAGANELPLLNNALKNVMTKLGYAASAQKYALRQIICITNNSQRELTDRLDFTTIHRYSVTDGQARPTYKKDDSAAYPAFIGDSTIFKQKNGRKAAFVELKSNEMLMVFDKIMVSCFQEKEYRYVDREVEHNEAFWTTNAEDLTPVGRAQVLLMRKLGDFWYNNRRAVPRISDLLRRITTNTPLKPFVERALALGRRVKADKNNVLVNRRILRKAWQQFNNPWWLPAPQEGAYKLLSDDAKAEKKEEHPLYLLIEKFRAQGKKNY